MGKDDITMNYLYKSIYLELLILENQIDDMIHFYSSLRCVKNVMVFNMLKKYKI